MIEREKCSVYIDESGDLGFNRGSHWFCMSAVIVRENDEKQIRSTIKKIKERLNVNYIHFVKIKEFSRRLYLVHELTKEPFTIISVIADTQQLQIAKKSTLYAYNYISRLLVERVSWFLRDNDLQGNIVFASRKSKVDSDLISYVRQLINYPSNTVCSYVFTGVLSKKAEEWDMLQLADVCASSLFKAIEPDDYGFRYPCFQENLSDHLYRYKGSIINYGIKYYPNSDNLEPVTDLPTPCNKKRCPAHVTHD